MNTFLWFCQLFSALVFAYSGMMKSTQSRERLVSLGQTGVSSLSYPLIRFIGISELLGSIGIILPWASGIFPFLTPLSALGFVLIMFLAAPIHYKRKEYKAVMLNIVLLIINVWIAYSRFIELIAS